MVSSPYAVAAIGISSIIALAAIVATTNHSMNSSLLAQEAIQIQTEKNQENLKMVISDDTLTIKNNGLNTVVIKEIRIYADESTLVSKKRFADDGLEVGPLAITTHNSSEFSIPSYDSTTVLAITSLGNVLSATNLDDLASNGDAFGTGNGQAMINGMGINSRIIKRDYVGRLNYGYGVSGSQNSLKTYNSVPALTDFAAQLLDTDQKIIIPIPKFNTEYRYISATQSLQEISSTNQNILGYSKSRTVDGSAVATVGTDAITIQGTGTVILQLNNFGDQTLILEGETPNGAILQLGTDLQYDYLDIPYHSVYGFQSYAGGLPEASYSQNGCSYASGAGYNCYASWTYTQSFSPPLILSSSANYYSYYYSSSFPFSILSGTQNPTSYSLSSIRMVASASSGWSKSCNNCYPTTSPVPSGYPFYVFDKELVINNKIDLSGSFQTPYNFQSTKQYYIIAKPNGGTIKIKGSVVDPLTAPYLKITNLPQNIPFEILKDGLVASKGMSQYEGTITLLINDVNISGTSPSGILHLYPDSLKYRGQFSTVVFDNVNEQVIHIQTQDDKVYIVHAYVQIAVVGNVTVTNTYLDNALALGYLDGNYTTGEQIIIPVIPGYYNINMDINGVPTTTVISNVLGGTGLKVISPSTSTITDYDDNSVISSISSTTGSTAYVISTTSGTITASVTATISGDSEIKNQAYFGSPPPPPPPPQPRDPLKAYVDIYKNGAFVSQQQIYFNPVPSVQNSGGASGSSSYVIDKYTYPQTVISGVITTNVFPGDMVEFYLYANIEAEGSAPPVPPGSILYHYAGEGHATTSIHSGTILTS